MTFTPSPSSVVRKVFICNNGNCVASQQAQEIYDTLLEMIHGAGLDQYAAPIQVKCVLSGCLDVCKNGPVMVIHPGAVVYQQVDRSALQRIFIQHLLRGEIVEENVYLRETTSNDHGIK